MHLLDAWKSLAVPELLRLLALPAAVLLAALLPGRAIARIAALVAAVWIALLPGDAVPAPVRAGWAALWLLVAWQAGVRGADGGARSRRRGALESGAVALPLGVGLLMLMLAALSRQGLDGADARRAALGVLLLGAGLLHLMLRRHARRALVAFASLGLGLELLGASARDADVLHAGAPAGAALAAATLAVALTWRVAGSRERYARSPLVSHAHDLRD